MSNCFELDKVAAAKRKSRGRPVLACWQSICSCLILVGLLCQLASAGSPGGANTDELYRLLGVSKKSTTKEIRQAFKKLALEKHPDKNKVRYFILKNTSATVMRDNLIWSFNKLKKKDDPNANEVFIRINRAYEILKDDDLRKKYDLYGEDGLKDNQNSGHNYQSWNFYQQNFGIYDDDPEIVTLSRADFSERSLSFKASLCSCECAPSFLG
jgi:curved DNA-binding protein CbpA